MSNSNKNETVSSEQKKNVFMKGLRSSSFILIVILLIALLNIGIKKWGPSWDVSADEVFTLTEQSKSIVAGLDDEVQIYVIQSEAKTDAGSKKLLDEYAAASKKLTVEYRDPMSYPSFVSSMVPSISDNDVSVGSILVVSGDKTKYIDSTNFTSYDYETYSTNVDFEPLVTSAISFVTSEGTSTFYLVKGHGESELSSSLSGAVEKDNYAIEDISLNTISEIPEDAGVVFLNGPVEDLGENECDILRDYVVKGGNVCVILSYQASNTPNLYALLAEWGVEANYGMVMEQNANMYYTDAPYYLFPEIHGHTITLPITEAGYMVMMPLTVGFVANDIENYQAVDLLTTSNSAYDKVDLTGASLTKGKDDPSGPFTVAALIQYVPGADEQIDNEPGQIFVLGSVQATEDDFNKSVYGSNVDFVMNTVDFMNEQEDKVSIRSKTIREESTLYKSSQMAMLVIFSCIILPVAIIAVGAFVCVSRKLRTKKSKKKKNDSKDDVSDEEEDEKGEEEVKEETSDEEESSESKEK